MVKQSGDYCETKTRKLIFIWVLLMLAGIFTAGCTYVAFQQTQRDAANQPAAQIAKQVAWEIDGNMTFEQTWNQLMGRDSQTTDTLFKTNLQESDMTQTLTPVVMIYDQKGNMVYTSTTPWADYWKLPSGVLNNIAKTGEDRVTWQPEKGQRFALVGVKAHPMNNSDEIYYVVGAYSLSESEKNVDKFAKMLLIGSMAYAIGCVVLLALCGFANNRRDGKKLREK